MKKAKTGRGRPKDPVKHKGGRPVKYTPEVLDKLGREMIKWFSVKRNIWLKDFAFKKGFHWSQFCQLAEKSEEFSQALKRAKEMQESKLFKAGLSKSNNASMAIFALKNVAGWRDKQEIEHTNAGGAFGAVDNAGLRELVMLYAKMATEKKVTS